MQLPAYLTAYCQATTVKYNGRDYSIQKDKNGFRYIKVSHVGKRKVIPVKDEVPDIIFDYIFNGVFKINPNKILDMCVLLRTHSDQEITFEKNKEKLEITSTFQEFKIQASKLNRQFKGKYE